MEISIRSMIVVDSELNEMSLSLALSWKCYVCEVLMESGGSDEVTFLGSLSRVRTALML